jgi:hypothetical protein
MSNFTDFLLSAADSAEKHVAEVHQAGAMAGHQAVVDSSRVWSGHMRGGHKMTIGEPPSGSNPRPAGAQKGEFGYPDLPVDVIEQIKAGNTSTTYTNVPYAPNWEVKQPMYEPGRIAAEDAMERKMKEGTYE